MTNPNALKNIGPDDMYKHLKKNGFDVQPLGQGSKAGIPFEQGGGFRITWGGDRTLRYNPGGGYHKGSYWVISSGTTGKITVPLDDLYVP